MGLASAYGLKYLEKGVFFGQRRLGREVILVFFFKKKSTENTNNFPFFSCNYPC